MTDRERESSATVSSDKAESISSSGSAASDIWDSLAAFSLCTCCCLEAKKYMPSDKKLLKPRGRRRHHRRRPSEPDAAYRGDDEEENEDDGERTQEEDDTETDGLIVKRGSDGHVRRRLPGSTRHISDGVRRRRHHRERRKHSANSSIGGGDAESDSSCSDCSYSSRSTNTSSASKGQNVAGAMGHSMSITSRRAKPTLISRRSSSGHGSSSSGGAGGGLRENTGTAAALAAQRAAATAAHVQGLQDWFHSGFSVTQVQVNRTTSDAHIWLEDDMILWRVEGSPVAKSLHILDVTDVLFGAVWKQSGVRMEAPTRFTSTDMSLCFTLVPAVTDTLPVVFQCSTAKERNAIVHGLHELIDYFMERAATAAAEQVQRADSTSPGTLLTVPAGMFVVPHPSTQGGASFPAADFDEDEDDGEEEEEEEEDTEFEDDADTKLVHERHVGARTHHP